MQHYLLKSKNTHPSFLPGLLCIAGCWLLSACSAPKQKTLFTLMSADSTHIDFTNQLTDTRTFNVYTYRNFYNGGGVALGDINNDGLIDVFFTGNMVASKLYLNKGNFQFEDITEKAGITKKGKWSTGVSMADVNGDGLLDIYVCNSGNVKGDNKENELFINNGNLTFTEKAAEWGVADKGYSTHAAFFDYDHDGDLDMYLLNNSFRPVSNFNLQNNERNVRDSLGGDKLFRNEGDHFTDVSAQAGVYGSLIGFGLGVTVGDVNNDGWDDIYVSNDFFERDYLYSNNHDGTFTESLEKKMKSISNTSMGADMADINNDGNADIFVTEMLPEKESRIKMNTMFESWDKYQFNLKYGYYHQFTRNTLQLNNGPSPGFKNEVSFSEVGRYAGVHATDWSWGALVTDLNNDGWKDIFVANGIYKDLTNQDFIQYLASPEFSKMTSSRTIDFHEFIKLIPSQAVPNYAFSNNGNLTFTNKAEEWGLGQPSFSNGSAYGDLDNDGDLDLVVNNVNMPCFVYRNEAVQQHPENKFLKVILQGEGKNRFGVGARVTVHYNNTIAYQEAIPMRGFESTVDSRLNFGLGKISRIDSVTVIWTDGKENVITNVHPNTTLTVKQSSASAESAKEVAASSALFRESSTNFGIDFLHRENDFVDFDRDKLIYHMLSTDGPRIAKSDVNKDGLEDFYICGAKESAGALYVQTKDGRFTKTNDALFAADALSEDTDALFFDADGDGDEDLFVCSGGNEFSPGAEGYLDRLYINDGKGKFSKSSGLLPLIAESSSCVRAADYDRDGDLDLFVGVRLKPFRYGYPCKSYLLQNNGKGVFTDVTDNVAPELKQVGMVTDAAWLDYDKDGRQDLAVTGEYMPVKLFHNENGKLKEVTSTAGLSKSNGWWNRIAIADVNNDGFPDIVAGNHGLNSRFKATAAKPVEMYVSDFDGNGSVEQVVTCFNSDTSHPMALRQDLVGVLPYLKQKFLKYADYKDATIQDVFTKEQLGKAVKLSAYNLQSCVLLNNGKVGFVVKPLPAQAQFSPVYGICVKDFDDDGKPDLLLGGNFFQSRPEAGIYDAGHGLVLKGDGKGNFTALREKESGIHLTGQVRDIVELQIRHKPTLVVACNSDKVRLFEKVAKGK
jgi:enediyne biosynthesis protein E4